jgi:hypothetical protein
MRFTIFIKNGSIYDTVHRWDYGKAYTY